MVDVVEITPDKERARSLLEMVDVRMETIRLLVERDISRFASKIIEEYYESLLELITAIMSLDGFKTRSDVTGSHISSIEYIRRYKELESHEIQMIDDLRKKRAGIKYYGRKVGDEYLKSRQHDINTVIGKLKSIAEGKL